MLREDKVHHISEMITKSFMFKIKAVISVYNQTKSFLGYIEQHTTWKKVMPNA